MSEIDEIKKRMERRRGRKNTTLTDRHFLKVYNAMIKAMVVLLVGVSVCAYVKISPNGEYIKNYVLNDLHFTEMTKWINNQVLSWTKNDNAATVSSKVAYTNIKDNFYTNKSNEVLNFDKGRVVYVGKQDMLGQYVIILLENNVEVTFGQLTDVFVSAHDQVDAATILGTYQDKVMIIFTQEEKEIDYATFEELLS
ncbi:MAG: M23 family metallopeptidase [Coprobacillus sp.]